MSTPRRRGRPPIAPAWVLLAVMAAGCGGGAKPPNADVADAPWEVKVESPLGEDAVAQDAAAAADSAMAASAGPAAAETSPASRPAVETPGAAPAAAADSAGMPAPAGATPSVPAPDPADFTKGWRVQIAALSTLADADARAREARTRFTEPVYVEYEPPFYKVRVGDFLTRTEAESMATRARAERYEGAWVVETLVLRPAR